MFLSVDVSAKPLQAESWKFPGYTVHNVPYDGQCAYTALGHQLQLKNHISKEASPGDAVRRDVVSFLQSNQQLQSVIAERLVGISMDDYINEMAKSSTWADENVMLAASLLYDVEICIL